MHVVPEMGMWLSTMDSGSKPCGTFIEKRMFHSRSYDFVMMIVMCSVECSCSVAIWYDHDQAKEHFDLLGHYPIPVIQQRLMINGSTFRFNSDSVSQINLVWRNLPV